MSLTSNLELFATRVGEEFATTYSQIGDVTTLPFRDQNLAFSVVALNDAVNGLSQGIDDMRQSGQIAAIEDSVAQLTTTYSSTKIEELIAAGGGTGDVTFTGNTLSGADGTIKMAYLNPVTSVESYAGISGQDFLVDVEDDVRIFGNDVYRLVNNSTDSGISIETVGGNFRWEFTEDGYLILPLNGEIRDTQGNNLLSAGGGVAIDDVTASTTTVYSSSKVDTLVDGAALVAAFEAALNA
jgi:hypothetical protein